MKIFWTLEDQYRYICTIIAKPSKSTQCIATFTTGIKNELKVVSEDIMTNILSLGGANAVNALSSYICEANVCMQLKHIVDDL